MNYSEGLSLRIVPPLSNRTLPHSMSLYMPPCLPYQGGSQTAHPIILAEVFYIDPTGCCRRRIPNLKTGVTVSGFSQFQLNTPQPIMSPCLAAPNRPDPFLLGQYPTRDLGSPTWRIHPQVQSRRVIIQLTQEEDQAITNLLKLHHQEELQHHELITAAHPDFSNAINPPPFLTDPTLQDSSTAEEAPKPACIDGQYQWELQQGRGWSDSELEAANTLLGGFNQDQGDFLRTPDQYKMETTGPDTLLCQKTEIQQGSETLSGSVTCDSLKCI